MTRESDERQFKWDVRYIEMTYFVAQWSKDPSTQTGAVIVRPDLTVAGVGYNGFPKNMSDDWDLYADRETKYSRIVHSEMNALLHTREPVEGYTLYTTGMCCDRCAVHMLQAGISRFVWLEDSEYMRERWAEAFERTQLMFEEAKVEAVEIGREWFEDADRGRRVRAGG